MTISISVTESQLYTALRSFLMGALTCPVVQGQQNRAATPIGDFVTMTSLGTQGLSTDVALNQPLAGTQSHSRGTQWNVQLDFYGPNAADYANTVATLIKTDYAYTQFDASAVDMKPLYAVDPRQVPFVNAEQQYEKRWVVEAAFQFNPVLTTAQQFADSLTVIPAEVDATFPPQ